MAREKEKDTAAVPAAPTPPAAAKPVDDPAADDPRDAELKALRDRLDQMEAMMKGGAVNALAAVERSQREKWFEAQAAEISKGHEIRSQEEADRRYPGGKHRYVCVLDDGNRHPRLVIGAENDVDAKARYMDVCGITSAEKAIDCQRA